MIKKRGESYQVSIHYDNKRYRKSFKVLKDAEIWEAQSKADLVAGRLPSLVGRSTKNQKPRTLQHLLDYTYKHHWSGQRSEDKTLINATKCVESIGGSIEIGDIDKFLIDEMVADFKKIGNKPSTINRKLAALSRMLRTAYELEIISKTPKISYLKEPTERIRWYTEEEKDNILQAFRELDMEDYAFIIRVLLDTGMRVGELLGLTWDDIDGSTIILNKTKNMTSRSIPMTPKVQQIMAYFSDIPIGPFQWTTYDMLNKRWKKVKKKLGWENDSEACLHVCRHTFITNLVQADTNLFLVQKLAGHKTLDMTKRYTHFAPVDLEKAIKNLVIGTA